LETSPTSARRKRKGLAIASQGHAGAESGMKSEKAAGNPLGHPPVLSCPSWARTRTLLIPYHFGFRRRSASVRGLDCAFTFALTRSGGSHPVSTPSPLSGLGSALPVKGPPTSRAFTRAVSGAVSSE